MKTFTDAEGREWTLRLDYAAVRRIRENSGIAINLMAVFEQNLLGRLLVEEDLVEKLLWALCGRQAEERKIDRDGFGAAIYGDVGGAARDALIEEIMGFFPGPEIREKLRAALEAARLIVPRALDMLEKEVQKMSESLAGNARASSGDAPVS